ncbi:MarR family winged helix-turn-helix transcriptional regulator [Kerstersia sp.]|uniref:MarR family winged helix-turn-helix transcriptional regulator n=1 Tax=Kerstersia sp. TaxID=1930783 RepID=UPI003F92D46E
MEQSKNALVLLRQIIRATDFSDKQLSRSHGLTLPQLLAMQSLKEHAPMHGGQLAQSMNLTQATVTTILDRLEKKELVQRRRDEHDKRRVWITLTDKGAALMQHSPACLQEQFVQRFDGLPSWEKAVLLASLQRLTHLLNASDIDAAPVLALGDLARAESD